MKISTVLHKKGLSYGGRVLIVNSLCASEVWYMLSVLEPAADYSVTLQKKFIDCVWQGRHWISREKIVLSKGQGGLGLVDINCRLLSFRARFIHDYLYGDDYLCFRLADSFFSKMVSYNYTKQLFLIDCSQIELDTIQFSFYMIENILLEPLWLTLI